MSSEPINRSPDLRRLRDEGYEVEARSGYLVIRSVPYVNPKAELARGILVTDLTLNDNVTQRPRDHQVWFAGKQSCDINGKIISALGARPERKHFARASLLI